MAKPVLGRPGPVAPMVRERPVSIGTYGKHTYFVFIPGYRITAEVRDAPTTKHARTAFLDFLVRQRRIPYTQRAKARKRMKTLKVERGEIPASVVLDYDMPEPYTDLPIAEAPYTEGLEEVSQWDDWAEEAKTELPPEEAARPQPATVGTDTERPFVSRPVTPTTRPIDVMSSPMFGGKQLF